MVNSGDDRSSRRKERYMILRGLGFSSEDARRLRDQSGENIQLEIRNERRRISRKSISRRSETEAQKLESIREEFRQTSPVARGRRLESRRERYNNFSAWSSTQNFPPAAIARIRQFNSDAGLSRDDGYGYRRYYFVYVERLPANESAEFADRADSGIRHMRHISLTSKVYRGRITENVA